MTPWVVLAIVFVLIILNFVFKRLLMHLKRRFHLKEQILKENAVEALFLPVSCLVWFFVILEIIDFISFRIVQKPIIPNKQLLLQLGFALALAWFFLRWKNDVVRYLLTKNKPLKHHIEPTTVGIVDKMVTVGIIFLTAFPILEMTGISFSSLIAFGGISGLAVAFASQEVIASFFGGLMIYITQPFGIGDWIILPEKNVEGYVEEIGWYMTKARTSDQTPIYIPNSVFSKIVIKNSSRKDK